MNEDATPNGELWELIEDLRNGDIDAEAVSRGDPPFYRGLEAAADELEELIEDE